MRGVARSPFSAFDNRNDTYVLCIHTKYKEPLIIENVQEKVNVIVFIKSMLKLREQSHQAAEFKLTHIALGCVELPDRLFQLLHSTSQSFPKL